MNNLDKQYQDLLKTILEHGVEKRDRTGVGTKSIFGYTIRHNMKDGFPLLTTKKMAWKQIVTELVWFLRGDTNIKFLIDNNCHIWNGDAIKNYEKHNGEIDWGPFVTKEEAFVESMKDDEFAKKWGELGPIYGAQWRDWLTYKPSNNTGSFYQSSNIDQILNLINDLKTNPDSRRLMVNAWNVGELNQMVLPPCHYGFQIYTRELDLDERIDIYNKQRDPLNSSSDYFHEHMDSYGIPRRAISLMWNQRSVDTFLGLPFNIASYGLLLEIIAKAVNMVPDQLIGNLGDTHIYLNHIDAVKEQIGREMTWEEQVQWVMKNTDVELENLYIVEEIAKDSTPKHTRQPYPLPKLNINTEWWPTESGECGEGPIDALGVFRSFSDINFCKCLIEEDIQLGKYKCHPTIKAPLNN